MAYKGAWHAIALSMGLIGCGAAADIAWRNAFWGCFAGAILAAVWLIFLVWWGMRRGVLSPTPVRERPEDMSPDRLLLDAVPIPMLTIDDGRARALNRAARQIFGTDDRILPPPAALLDPEAGHLHHEGRHWRIDRVRMTERSVAALIDVEQEERTAEARATAEMIHVLGHELLNGLAPIVSLAESGEAALDRTGIDPGLLREILGTLARRAESLQRFTEAYRELARLPAPRLARVSVSKMADDLSRLFAGRWPNVEFVVEESQSREWALDRDQVEQAVWALLQNAAEAATSAHGSGARVSLTIDYGLADLTLAVEDNGMGVSREDASRIFRPFHTTKPEGSGIGLSLARQIAQGHAGELFLVRTQPTTFVFKIPALQTAQPF
jgi:signal transduction histidine kinase